MCLVIWCAGKGKTLTGFKKLYASLPQVVSLRLDDLGLTCIALSGQLTSYNL